jgi:uncharacterized membrane protein YphA (DoxX/SURF4 family)
MKQMLPWSALKPQKLYTMKKTKILYWVFTGLFAAFMLMSAIPDIFSIQIAKDGFTKMDMPLYLLPFLGIAKTLGVIAIVVPGYPRIKEWAYAGLIFDLIGATYAIISSGQSVNEDGGVIFMVIPIALAILSYVYYHKKLRAESMQSAIALQ